MNIRKIFRQIDSLYDFKGEFNYNFKFRVSFPINKGFIETDIINVTIPASSPIEAKKKLNQFVKNKIKITVVSINEL